jgi:hypothetical protein
MCTVTFMPRARGYCLAMNRDEKRARPKGLPPTRRTVQSRKVLCPSEAGGGTWIALNDSGTSVALINWHSVAGRAKGHAVTRGSVIGALGAASQSDLVEVGLSTLPLTRINPFRLIGVFPGTRRVTEWRWDLKRLTRKSHRWRARQWISSGFDERTAQRVRNQTLRRAQRQKSAGSLAWLRRLHRSHVPQVGPFSICMHREDAATVSYTEIAVSSRAAVMRYQSGAPCRLFPFASSPNRRICLPLHPYGCGPTKRATTMQLPEQDSPPPAASPSKSSTTSATKS